MDVEEKYRFLKRQEVARILDKSTKTLSREYQRGEGPPCVRVGREYGYPVEEFWEYVYENDVAFVPRHVPDDKGPSSCDIDVTEA